MGMTHEFFILYRFRFCSGKQYMGVNLSRPSNWSILHHLRFGSGPIVAVFIGLLSTEPAVAAVAVVAVPNPGTPALCWRRNCSRRR